MFLNYVNLCIFLRFLGMLFWEYFFWECLFVCLFLLCQKRLHFLLMVADFVGINYFL